ncbi:MAG TPA: tripartite tricarboxylate transporter substrate-binding protein [Casimicrobiaceae bacterium]
MSARGRREAVLRLAALGAAAAAARPLFAADAVDAERYPSRPIRMVVGSAAGTGDVIARLYATRLADAWGQPVVVENRPGASYNIASDVVARAPPDGYTILWATSQITVTPTIVGPSVVDPVASFAPIAKVLVTPVFVFVHRSLGVATLPELIALSRSRPLSYATGGLGSLPHLAMETILRRAGTAMVHVPYGNTGQAFANFVSGEVPVYVSFYISVMAALRDGTARAIAVASDRRSPTFPDVPSVAELGYPEAAVEPWAGFAAPAGTPPAIVDKLHRELVRIMELPDTRERYLQVGMDTVVSTPASMAADIRRQTAAWPAIVKAAGVKVGP